MGTLLLSLSFSPSPPLLSVARHAASLSRTPPRTYPVLFVSVTGKWPLPSGTTTILLVVVLSSPPRLLLSRLRTVHAFAEREKDNRGLIGGGKIGRRIAENDDATALGPSVPVFLIGIIDALSRVCPSFFRDSRVDRAAA